MAQPTSPPAVRQHLPSWLDLRLVLGVLLVLVSVLVGARVVASADRSVRVWAVRADLSAGTTLAAGDVGLVRVRLFADADRYLAAGRSPAGLTLTRDLGAGELLPRGAVTPQAAGSVLSVPVTPQHVPQTLRAGQRIDVYVTTKVGSGVPRTDLVLAAVPVQQVLRPNGGLLSSTAQVAVIVRVPPAQAPTAVRAIRAGDVDITVVEGPSTGSPSPAARPAVARPPAAPPGPTPGSPGLGPSGSPSFGSPSSGSPSPASAAVPSPRPTGSPG